jgi:hypothetical protein
MAMSAIVFALDSERFAHRCAWSSTVRLKPWEGPFADLTQRLPQAPEVAAERNADASGGESGRRLHG